jgi:FkbM family methyltransferase
MTRLQVERKRLQALPRHQETSTFLPGFEFKIPDAASFLASWDEIFTREIYKFRSQSDAPRILDCGANVGVSCLFFQRHYPQAQITAFEPDPQIYGYLSHNLQAGGLTNTKLVPKGVWSSETTLSFFPEGADGGRIEASSGNATIEIKTVRLFDYLSEPVDLLKIDIEGAETEVLRDAAARLGNVHNLFVEYHSFADRPQTLDQLLQILREAGFRVHIQTVCPATQPLLKVETVLGLDMQLNIFASRT